MQLQLKRVSKQVGAETHLYPIDLSLQPGTINVLLGPTQAGKTSLMRLMAGLDRPTDGEVWADGRNVTGVSVRQRKLAMVYQQFINYPSFTVYDNIASPLKLAGGLSDAEIRARVEATARKMHIDHLLHRLPGELSGGQQQRTALARALVKGASLLLLDEPLVNLDYKLREELRAELRELFSNSDTTVVYATTEPQEALLLGGYTTVMDQGRVLQFGPTLDVFHHPASKRVAEVFSDPPMNLLSVDVAQGRASLSANLAFEMDAHLAGLPNGRSTLGVRPSHVRLTAQTAGDYAIPCEVELAELSGSDTFLHARHGDVGLVAQLQGVHNFDPSSHVTLYLNPAELFAFDAEGRLIGSPDRAVVAAQTRTPATTLARATA